MSINVGLCGNLLLREALKGEVVIVGIALVGISNSFSFRVKIVSSIVASSVGEASFMASVEVRD